MPVDTNRRSCFGSRITGILYRGLMLLVYQKGLRARGDLASMAQHSEALIIFPFAGDWI